MPKRIIPISSGKGGVGKTTLAVNFALRLSEVASTVLVDLDTGTSSVRGAIQVPIARDLYHFKRKGVKLSDCITRLPHSHDPDGKFRRFGFVSGPRNFIDDLANPDAAFRRRLAEEIVQLPADYVVLDLRAGLDDNVLDFLPYTNSGILVFTPNHPSATLAASDIVKAILFRSLRIVFGKGSTFYNLPGMERFYQFINELLGQVEDVYDGSIPNLDAFVRELREALGDHPILRVLTDTLENFRVFYVLNMFDGVEQSYEKAIVPFVDNLAQNVSRRINITQLGWVVDDSAVHEANCAGVPMLLELAQSAHQKRRASQDRVMAELEALESAHLGIRRRKKPVRDKPAIDLDDPDVLLAGQLDTLQAMYSDRRQDSVRENFSYLAFRALNLMSPLVGANEFGMTRMAVPERLLNFYLSRT